MRLWYQSMTAEGSWPAYNVALRRILDRVRDSGTEITVHGMTKVGGIGDQYRYLEFLETAELLENVARAEQAGYDAFLIGNIADPGIFAAREMASIPILGLCETSLHLACMMGQNFAIIAANKKFAPRIIENVGRYGLAGRLASVGQMNVDRLVGLDSGFTDSGVGAALCKEFEEAAESCAKQGAETIIPAVGVMMALLAERNFNETTGGAVVLNGILALVKIAESAVRMRRLMGGRFTSKVCMYAAPPIDQIIELRRAYGDIYPSLENPGIGSQRESPPLIEKQAITKSI